MDKKIDLTAFGKNLDKGWFGINDELKNVGNMDEDYASLNGSIAVWFFDQSELMARIKYAKLETVINIAASLDAIIQNYVEEDEVGAVAGGSQRGGNIFSDVKREFLHAASNAKQSTGNFVLCEVEGVKASGGLTKGASMNVQTQVQSTNVTDTNIKKNDESDGSDEDEGNVFSEIEKLKVATNPHDSKECNIPIEHIEIAAEVVTNCTTNDVSPNIDNHNEQEDDNAAPSLEKYQYGRNVPAEESRDTSIWDTYMRTPIYLVCWIIKVVLNIETIEDGIGVAHTDECDCGSAWLLGAMPKPKEANENESQRRVWFDGVLAFAKIAAETRCLVCFSAATAMLWLDAAQFKGGKGYSLAEVIALTSAISGGLAKRLKASSSNVMSNGELRRWALQLWLLDQLTTVCNESSIEMEQVKYARQLAFSRFRAKFQLNGDTCQVINNVVNLVKRSPAVVVQAGICRVDYRGAACEGECNCASPEYGKHLEQLRVEHGCSNWALEENAVFGQYGQCGFSVSHVQQEQLMIRYGKKLGIDLVERYGAAAGVKLCWLDLVQKADFNPHLCRQEYMTRTVIVSASSLRAGSPRVAMLTLLFSRWITRGWTLQEAVLPRQLSVLTAEGYCEVRSGAYWNFANGALTAYLDDIMPWEQDWTPRTLYGLQNRVWRYEKDFFDVLSLSFGVSVSDYSDVATTVPVAWLGTILGSWPQSKKNKAGMCWVPDTPPDKAPELKKSRLTYVDIDDSGLGTYGILGAVDDITALGLAQDNNYTCIGLKFDWLIPMEGQTYIAVPVEVTGTVKDDMLVHKLGVGVKRKDLSVYRVVAGRYIVVGSKFIR